MKNQQNPPYMEQYYRMKRWYQRMKNSDSESSFLFPFLDDIGNAFFITCFHLKDWILNDDLLDVNIRKNVEKFVNNSPLLEMCRSVCHNSKHLKSNNPKVINSLEVKRMAVTHNLYGPGASYSTVHGFIEIGEDAYDISSLAELCIKEWDRYFTENHMIIPPEPTLIHFDLPSKLKKKFERNDLVDSDQDGSPDYQNRLQESL